MIKLRLLYLCFLASALVLPAFTQEVAATVRITQRIDESQLVTLSGNTHPYANAKNDRGPVSPSLPMTDLILVLSRSQQQQAAFDAYVTSQYDQNSPNFHQWLTPDQIGQQFGPSQTDILTIQNWLTGHGFAVSQITRDHMTVRFSGTAGQVQSAFHTEIHNLVVKGQSHIGNMTDPQIPSSLSSVVVGVKSLHNFFPTPAHHIGKMVQRDASSGQWARPTVTTAANAPGSATKPNLAIKPSASVGAKPQYGISPGGAYLVEDIGPWDFANIYNVAPLWSASTPIDGKGQIIAIAGTSAIDIGEAAGSGAPGSGTAVQANSLNDVTTFRDFFNLPTNNSYNQPIQVSGNSSPLTVCNGTPTGCSIDDLLENSLDVEWSGSVAKNAQIVLVASYPTGSSDDTLYDSESYIVDNVGNSSSPVYGVHVMNVSYGECELGLGTAGNVQYYDLWQEAAAEGLAVFVATGDSGSSSCDDGGDQSDGTPYAAQFGLSVSGLASTPYNTAVGGTDFNWCPLNTAVSSECSASPYWNSTNSSTNQSTAIGYIPELPWNDTCTSPLALTWMESYFNGYPYVNSNNQNVNVTDAETGCNAIAYWDYEVGLPTAVEDVVDTVGGSGGASSCVVNTTNPTGFSFGTCSTGQTTTGSTNNPDNNATQLPVTVAGDTAANNTGQAGWPKPAWQVNAASIGVPSDGVRDIPDVSFFASDGFMSSSAYLICVSAAATYYGNDQPCSYSSSSEPFAEEVGGTSVATPAMAGVMALINQRAGAAQGSPNSKLYSLAATQTYSSCSSERGGGAPVTSSNCLFNDIDTGTNAMACQWDYYSSTPSPNCAIAHSNDYIGILKGYSASTGYDEATGLGSLNVANVVNAWAAVAPGGATPTVTVTPSPNSINSTNTVNVTVTVAGGAGAPQDGGGHTVVPTGTVTLTASGSSYTATGSLSTAGSYTFTIPANNLPGTTAGQADTLTASYAGDVNYAAKTGTGSVTVTTTVASLTPTVTVTPASNTVNSSASLNVTVSVTGSGVLPTGTITLSGGGYTSAAETIGTAPCTSNTTCVFTIPANSLSSGADTLTASYSGDSNYISKTGTGSVTVTESTFTLTPPASSPAATIATPGQSGTVLVTVAPVAGYTGTVSLSCSQTSGPTESYSDDTPSCTGSNSGQVNLATCGANCSVTFTVATQGSFTVAQNRRPDLPGSRNREWLGAGSGTVLALIAFFSIPARRRSWRSMLSVLVATVFLGVMFGCGSSNSGGGGGGGGGYTDPGTATGTYTFKISASSSPSVTPAVTTTFNVTVN